MERPVILTHSHSLTVKPPERQPCEGLLMDPVGEALRRARWLQDLERLDRIEFQNACFFDAMGQLHAERPE